MTTRRQPGAPRRRRRRRRRPAFSRMFVVSERVAELDALLFARRRRAPSEAAVLVHRLVREGPPSPDRVRDQAGRFFGPGRERSNRRRRCLPVGPGARVGAVLDPVMSLTARSIEGEGLGRPRVRHHCRASRPAARSISRASTGRCTRSAGRSETPSRRARGGLQRTRLEPCASPSSVQLFRAALRRSVAARHRPRRCAADDRLPGRLWGRGISGDDPDRRSCAWRPPTQIFARQRCCAALPALLRRPLRLRPLRPAGVGVRDRGAKERCSASLAAAGAAEWLNRHGGVYVLAADQLPDDERRHLEASARVLLTRETARSRGLDTTVAARPRMPRFERHVGRARAALGRRRVRALLFDNGTGGFHHGRPRVRHLRSARAHRPRALVQRPCEPRVRMPRQRVLSRGARGR